MLGLRSRLVETFQTFRPTVSCALLAKHGFQNENGDLVYRDGGASLTLEEAAGLDGLEHSLIAYDEGMWG